MARQQMGERGLSRPDISLHGNKMIVHAAVNIRIPFVLSRTVHIFFTVSISLHSRRSSRILLPETG
jgi:hypothetical protein